MHRFIGGGLIEDHRELVPAQAPDDIDFTQNGRQQLTEPLQQPISGMVAAGVVDVFELIQIEEQQRAGAAVAPGRRHRVIQLLGKPTPVVKPGERIVIRQPRQPQFGLFSGGDIHAHRQDQRGVVALALEAGMLPDHLERALVLAADLALFLKMRQAARHQLRQTHPRLIGAFPGQQQCDEGLSFQLLQVIARDRLPVRIDHQNFVFSILGQNDGLRGVQDVSDEVALLDDLAHAFRQIPSLFGHFGIQGFQLVRDRNGGLV